MDPAALPGYLAAIRQRAERGAFPAVMAMAQRYERYVISLLQLSKASPGQFGTPAPAGAPPAFRTGALARSVWTTPGASGGAIATASVEPHVIYGRTQEYGMVHRPTRARYMRWVNTGGEWFRKRVNIPDRPYLRPAHEAVIADGSLTRAAMVAWVAAVGI